MKLNKILAAFMLIMAVAFAACDQNPPVKPDDRPGQGGKDTTTVVAVAPDTIGWNIPAECLTVAQAREICAKLESGATSVTKYYVKGWVKKLATNHADGISKYGNALFYIEDIKDAQSQEDFYAFQVYGLNGEKISHPEAIAVGDYVVIYGEFTNYNGTYETVGKGAAYVWKSTNPNIAASGEEPGINPGEVTGEGTLENPYTAADILALNNTKTGNYWVKAYIVGQVNGASLSNSEFDAPFSPSTNNDGTVNTYNTNILIAVSATESNKDNCVPVQLPAGALRSGLNLPENPEMDGKEILIYGSLEKYFGAAGIKAPSYAQVGDKEFGNKPGEEPKPDNGGEGTYETPFSVTDVITLNNTKTGKYWVKAFIVGQVNGASISNSEFNAPFTPSTNSSTGQQNTYNTNILIADNANETDINNCVPVQLPAGDLRTGLNLPENPEMDGQEILIYGSLEKYFSVAGVKFPTYAKVGDKEFGTNPNGGNSGNTSDGAEVLNETLGTQASFNKFTAVNVSGAQVWQFDASYSCAKMSGYANSATVPNEDWFVSPAMDLSGKTSISVSFTHAFGPATSVPTTEATKAQYTVWVSNDFNGDVKAATWTELKGMVYGTSGWGWVSSGELAIPSENLKANCRIAWKYVCENVSATWEIKEVIVK